MPTTLQGGSYTAVRNANKGLGGEVHHIIPDSVSPIPTGKGPSILMEAADHAKTASYGSSNMAKIYRAEQKTLIDAGNYRGAAVRDLQQMHSEFSTKYNQGALQSIDYMKTMPEFKK